MINENTALESVFPDDKYWDIDEPKAFDFVANEGRASKAMQAYLDKMRDYKGSL
jgi:hypothetical protein